MRFSAGRGKGCPYIAIRRTLLQIPRDIDTSMLRDASFLHLFLLSKRSPGSFLLQLVGRSFILPGRFSLYNFPTFPSRAEGVVSAKHTNRKNPRRPLSGDFSLIYAACTRSGCLCFRICTRSFYFNPRPLYGKRCLFTMSDRDIVISAHTSCMESDRRG